LITPFLVISSAGYLPELADSLIKQKQLIPLAAAT